MTTPRQIDLARRAQRGEQALKAAGYQSPQLAPALASVNAGDAALTHSVINLTAAATTVLVGGAPGQRIQIYALFLWSALTQELEFYQGTKSLTGPLTAWPAAQGLLYPFVDEPYFDCDAGLPFSLRMSNPGQVSGWLKFRLA